MGATVTPSNATFAVYYGTPIPLQDACDLVTQVGCVDVHFNVPVTIDTSVGGCADQVAAYLAAKLPAGVKVHVEYGNECWNTSFATSFYCSIQNAFVTGSYLRYSYQQFFARQTKVVHDRFRAVVRLGRSTR